MLFTTPALADYRVAVRAGADWWMDTSSEDEIQSSDDPAFIGSLAVGYDIPLNDRWTLDLELEGIHSIETVVGANAFGFNFLADDETLHVTSLMLNVWPRWDAGYNFSIYAGGGVGPTWFQASQGVETMLSGQVGAGVLYGVTDNIDLELGYRYMTASSFEVEDMFSLAYDRHVVLAGVHYHFNSFGGD